MRAPFAVAATLLSSALFGLAFPPAGLPILAFVCLVPLLIALRDGGLARALGLAWLWAVASSWAIAPLFPASIARYYEQPLWVGLIVGTSIFTVTASLYYMVFAAIDRVLQRRVSIFSPLLTAAAWSAIELARGRLLTDTPFLIGNPWGLLGYTHASGSLAQIASWTGVYGIGFVIVATNAGIAGWIAVKRDRARSGRSASLAVAAMGLAFVPAIAAALAGAVALRAAPPPEREELVEVAVVQANVSIGRTWRSDYYGKNLDLYLDLSRRAIQAGSPRTIVWPEGAMNFFVESEPLYREVISGLLEAGDVELLAGGPHREEADGARVFNSIFAFSPDGSIVGRYDKQVLVPFSETFPLRTGALMRRRVDGARTFMPGPPSPAPIATRLGRAGLLICNEAMFPEIAAARVRAGAEILISPSNDSWIAGDAFAEHMLAVVGLRAIEQRRYLVRASTSGPSAIVDPWGRRVVRTSARTPHLLRGGVRPEQALTPYARWGDAFGLACAGWVSLVLVLEVRGGRRLC